MRQAKLDNKKRLALYIGQQLNVVVNPKALFDVQIKRIHEYKRQLMNVLHVIARYNRIKADPKRTGCHASISLPVRRPRPTTWRSILFT